MSTTPATVNHAAPPAIARARLPYHPALQERFGVDQSAWRALTDAIFPSAQTTESVILALAYCKARNLDPFKRQCHIVPIWDNKARRYVETVWPSISELRTTAFRTGKYAGRDPTSFGPDLTSEFPADNETVKVVHPEWAQITVYRLVEGVRQPFPGPTVYWSESYASKKGGAPNEMWRKRPRGQLEKVAEAAALRAAFPEELGGELCADEVGDSFQWHGRPALAAPDSGKTRTEALAEKLSPPQPEPEDQSQELPPTDNEYVQEEPGEEEQQSRDPSPESEAPPPELYDDLLHAIERLTDPAQSLAIRQRIANGAETGELTVMGVTKVEEKLEAKLKTLRRPRK